ADRVQDVGERDRGTDGGRGLDEHALELLALYRLPVETRVLDGDRRLVRDALRQLDLFRAPRPLPVALVEEEHPHGTALAHGGNREQRAWRRIEQLPAAVCRLDRRCL